MNMLLWCHNMNLCYLNETYFNVQHLTTKWTKNLLFYFLLFFKCFFKLIFLFCNYFDKKNIWKIFVKLFQNRKHLELEKQIYVCFKIVI